MTAPLRELVPGQVWLKDHPVRIAGARLLTRMTVLRGADGGVFLHSPVIIDDATRAVIDAIGPVRAIIAPSNCHHLFVGQAQQVFPSVPTLGVEGVESKRPDLRFDALIGDDPPALWAGQMDQVCIGNRIMCEVDFLHRASRTLVVTDLVENFRYETPGTNRMLRGMIRCLGMWGKPKPAPELRWFTLHRAAAREALGRMLAWEFDRIVLAHGEPILHEPKAALRKAWAWLLD
ncbi:MAG: hypothetical protein JSS21_12305 [Proteobacteria bacterium]|nr:hypothetical protein [Pseudomonadota bacterium]